MAIDVKVDDPHQLILDISIKNTNENRPDIIIRYNGTNPLYKMDTRPRGAIVVIKDGRTRCKATLDFSGLPFPSYLLPQRIVIYRRPRASSDPASDPPDCR